MNTNYLPEGARLHTPENRELLASPAGLEKAMNQGIIVEGIVTMCDNALCLHVDLQCAQGKLEADEVLYCRAGETRKDIAVISRVGKPVAVKIMALEASGGKLTAILSRRLAQKEYLSYLFSKMQLGDLLSARVTHLEPFGAFLDIGCGVASLLSVDCISVSRISHPRDRLRVGMELPVAIKALDRDGERIYVTLRELLGTWEQNAAQFEAGQTVTGVIRSVESYGVFVELAPNLSGLAELKPDSAEELRAKVGHVAAVYIKSIVPERMKIKLVLIDVSNTRTGCKDPVFYVNPKDTHHLSHWVYSPPCSHRRIETVFDSQPADTQ
ncbi:MAG: 30S ribosomal protein S1 [Ruminococcaceae bacterium]|nr:30S ribosomal protein S1 [Oscillospiraceae bacterium]